jgi:hypothetical protein
MKNEQFCSQLVPVLLSGQDWCKIALLSRHWAAKIPRLWLPSSGVRSPRPSVWILQTNHSTIWPSLSPLYHNTFLYAVFRVRIFARILGIGDDHVNQLTFGHQNLWCLTWGAVFRCSPVLMVFLKWRLSTVSHIKQCRNEILLIIQSPFLIFGIDGPNYVSNILKEVIYK